MSDLPRAACDISGHREVKPNLRKASTLYAAKDVACVGLAAVLALLGDQQDLDSVDLAFRAFSFSVSLLFVVAARTSGVFLMASASWLTTASLLGDVTLSGAFVVLKHELPLLDSTEYVNKRSVTRIPDRGNETNGFVPVLTLREAHAKERNQAGSLLAELGVLLVADHVIAVFAKTYFLIRMHEYMAHRKNCIDGRFPRRTTGSVPEGPRRAQQISQRQSVQEARSVTALQSLVLSSA
ncbi:uncharacterized protein LOC135386076 [Ornithodoros turicata]|uniref:uncharacterized protein LOC135386076 n=1 Tax=Ornithodoros turicata TaxID=34597 RepID=UPI00313944F6